MYIIRLSVQRDCGFFVKCLLLCGDIEDRTIRRIDDNCLQDVVYIKIPHHASAVSSSLMFERLQKNETADATATTTTFKANKLPDGDLLNKYKIISKESEQGMSLVYLLVMPIVISNFL